MTVENVWRRVLDECNRPTVLLDLGASAGPPEVWSSIAPSCAYVALEPDRRSNSETPHAGFKTTTMVCAAATDLDRPSVRLYLTRSRFCSSTLAPEGEDLRKFVFTRLFDVESTEVVRATTIDQVLRSHALDRIHWFKADTQGTDLRLFRSVSSAIRAGILAVDVEPGLIRAYQAEDLFTEAHEYFTKNGFWLSSMKIGMNARGSQGTLSRMLGNADAGVESVPHQYRQTPVCCEARYLRELIPGALTRDDLAVLATFAAMDNQPVFAVETINSIPSERRGAAIQALEDSCVAAVCGTAMVSSPGLLSRIGRRLGL